MQQQDTVYLIRHGAALPTSATGDRGRVLSERGRAAFSALVAEITPELKVRRILTSPFARARETACLLGDALGIAPEEELELASGALSGAGLLQLARRAGPGTALVGHNPELSEAVTQVARQPRILDPGSIAAVALVAHGPRLLWVRAP